VQCIRYQYFVIATYLISQRSSVHHHLHCTYKSIQTMHNSNLTTTFYKAEHPNYQSLCLIVHPLLWSDMVISEQFIVVVLSNATSIQEIFISNQWNSDPLWATKSSTYRLKQGETYSQDCPLLFTKNMGVYCHNFFKQYLCDYHVVDNTKMPTTRKH
jgi:hypothetical protein